MIYRGIYRDLWGNFTGINNRLISCQVTNPSGYLSQRLTGRLLSDGHPVNISIFVWVSYYIICIPFYEQQYIYIHRETKVYPRTANHIIFILHQRLFAVLIVRTLLCRLKFVRPNSVLKRFMYDVGTRHGTSWHSLHELILSVVKNGEVLRLPKLYSVPIHNLVTCQ